MDERFTSFGWVSRPFTRWCACELKDAVERRRGHDLRQLPELWVVAELVAGDDDSEMRSKRDLERSRDLFFISVK